MILPWFRVLQSIATFSGWALLINAQRDAHSRVDRTQPATVATTCDAITINYITHSLPQSCLTSTWASSEPTIDPTTTIQENGTENVAVSTDSQEETAAAPSNPPDTETDSHADGGDGATRPFMSFEDWKEKMLRETGQDPQDLRARNADRPRGDDRTPPDMGHAGLGEEDEISLNFDSYADNKPHDQKDHAVGSYSASADEQGIGEPVVYDDGRPSIHRSKDAGKTCKERFSYSSFDAGATVLKSSPGSKNAKAILVEYKDSYMLLECSAKQKFVIVELSEDILIDTIVLANFEFFSSMIRHFRVSVSDRYPVKSDRWSELGTFEARNSRDIQPFLIDNPQIWAKYVQIEFLTHYGNEYYCPVSLLRVHGSRMLDSWKESEAGRDEEPPALDEPEPRAEIDRAEGKPTSSPETSDTQETQEASAVETPLNCTVNVAADLFAQLAPTCAVSFNQTTKDSSHRNASHIAGSVRAQITSNTAEGRETVNMSVTRTESSATEDSLTVPLTTASPTETTQAMSPSPSSISSSSGAETVVNSTSQVTSTRATSISEPTSNTSVAPVSKTSPPGAAGSKNRTSGATGPSAAQPPVQEGFFKAITKRLQQVESNLTLSLKYVEDQARHHSESLQRTEQKQIAKMDLYLENLNQTVLGELRNLRDQYDQIWQSTVIALQSQREQSQREIVALSTRLNLLADEVVFQKRMAIVQAGLLLSCLFLVIFSRGNTFMDQTHGPAFDDDAPRDDHVHQDGGYRPVTPAAQNSLPTSPSQLHDQFSAKEKAALLQSERLSPPPTPNLADDLLIPDIPLQPRAAQSAYLRHASSKQQNNATKPLPAVPENTSSP